MLFLIIIILGGIYIVRLRRRQKNASAGNVVYVNTTIPESAEDVPSPEHKYDDVVLHVSSDEAAYVNTAVDASTGHVYNDVVIPAGPAVDDTPYDYARSEDVVRNKVKEHPTYHNHELK